jgi:hypothetical protein
MAAVQQADCLTAIPDDKTSAVKTDGFGLCPQQQGGSALAARDDLIAGLPHDQASEPQAAVRTSATAERHDVGVVVCQSIVW